MTLLLFFKSPSLMRRLLSCAVSIQLTRFPFTCGLITWYVGMEPIEYGPHHQQMKWCAIRLDRITSGLSISKVGCMPLPMISSLLTTEGVYRWTFSNGSWTLMMFPSRSFIGWYVPISVVYIYYTKCTNTLQCDTILLTVKRVGWRTRWYLDIQRLCWRKRSRLQSKI